GGDSLCVGREALLNTYDPAPYQASENYYTSFETISYTAASTPTVNADDVWVVFVVDYGGDGTPSTFTLTATETLPTTSAYANGTPYDGSIGQADGGDFLAFAGRQGQVVRLEASGLAEKLDPAVPIFDPDHPADSLGYDDDDGPGRDALIQGVRL